MRARLQWGVPATWSAAVLLLCAAPGDEYSMLWAGTLPFVAILVLGGDSLANLPVVILLAVVLLALAGRALDRLRASPALWSVVVVVFAVGLAALGLAGQPSLAAAARKHGSLWAYVGTATALAVTAATLLLLVVTLVRGWLRLVTTDPRQEADTWPR